MPSPTTQPFVLAVGEIELRTHAAAALSMQARAVLQTVAGLMKTDPGIGDGSMIECGGALFVLVREGNGHWVREPNHPGMTSRDDLNPDITRSLLVLVRQLRFVKTVGTEPMECSFRQSITAPRGLDWSKKIYMKRSHPRGPGDSGWVIGSAAAGEFPPPTDPAAYEKVSVHALLTLCPAAMQALLLPEGYIVLIEENRVLGVADENDKEVWRAAPSTNTT